MSLSSTNTAVSRGLHRSWHPSCGFVPQRGTLCRRNGETCGAGGGRRGGTGGSGGDGGQRCAQPWRWGLGWNGVVGSLIKYWLEQLEPFVSGISRIILMKIQTWCNDMSQGFVGYFVRHLVSELIHNALAPKPTKTKVSFCRCFKKSCRGL